MSENEIHAHVETASRDCDGLYTSGFLLTLNDDERVSESDDLRFHERVLGYVVNTYSIMDTGMLTVSRLSDGDVRLSWSESTEEGYRNVEATICTDPCDLGEDHWQRDHSAEAAGY